MMLATLSGCQTTSKEKLYERLQNAYDLSNEATSKRLDYLYKADISREVGDGVEEHLVFSNQVVGEKEEGRYHFSLISSLDEEEIRIDTWFIDDMLYIVNEEEGNQYGSQSEEEYLALLKENFGEFEITIPKYVNIEKITVGKDGKLIIYTVTLTQEAREQFITAEGLFEEGTIPTTLDIVFSVTENYLNHLEIHLYMEEMESENETAMVLTEVTYSYDYSGFDETQIEELDLNDFMDNTEYTSLDFQTKEEFIDWLVNKYDYVLQEDGTYRQEFDGGEYYYFDFDNHLYIYEYNEIQYSYDWNTEIGQGEGCVFNLKDSSVISGECSEDDITNIE